MISKQYWCYLNAFNIVKLLCWRGNVSTKSSHEISSRRHAGNALRNLVWKPRIRPWHFEVFHQLDSTFASSSSSWGISTPKCHSGPVWTVPVRRIPVITETSRIIRSWRPFIVDRTKEDRWHFAPIANDLRKRKYRNRVAFYRLNPLAWNSVQPVYEV